MTINWSYSWKDEYIYIIYTSITPIHSHLNNHAFLSLTIGKTNACNSLASLLFEMCCEVSTPSFLYTFCKMLFLNYTSDIFPDLYICMTISETNEIFPGVRRLL